MYFIITTNKEVAEQIRKQCLFDEKMGNRSYKLGDISHNPGFSDVQIVAKNEKIEPADLFWLGHYSAQVPVYPPVNEIENVLLSQNHNLEEIISLLKAALDDITTRYNALCEKAKIIQITDFSETVNISETVKTIKP